MKTIANNSFLVYYILNETKAQNVDNISRTKAYERFFRTYPEIKWAFLASIVSRNAGWNMTDLTIHPFRTLLGERERNHLFLTYDRANWLIFSDAYPQLLVYQFSKKFQKPLFHLLAQFKVSEFMVKEWNHFWKTKDEYRLMAALIINEQQVIDESVIQKEISSGTYLGNFLTGFKMRFISMRSSFQRGKENYMAYTSISLRK
jgi:hypothetical protein